MSDPSVGIVLFIELRDVAHVLISCLQHLKHLVDAYYIEYVRSTDQTKALLKKWEEENGNAVYDIECSPQLSLLSLFPPSSLFSLEKLQQIAPKIECLTQRPTLLAYKKWYLLIWNPYFRMDQLANLDSKWKENLTLPVYDMSHREGASAFRLPRLIQIDGKGQSVRFPSSILLHPPLVDVSTFDIRTSSDLHQYYQENTSVFLKRTAEISRDIPEEHAYLIGLWSLFAQDYDRALRWFSIMVSSIRPALQEALWHARYCIGKCYEHLHQWEAAFKTYLHAYESRPARLEPILPIIQHFRQLKQFHVAQIFLSAIEATPFPDHDRYGIEYSAYHFRRLEESSILSCRVDRKQAGQRAAEILLMDRLTPYATKILAWKNQRWYTYAIPFSILTSLRPTSIPSLQEIPTLSWYPSNPSLLLLSKAELEHLHLFATDVLPLDSESFYLINVSILSYLPLPYQYEGNPHAYFTFNVLCVVHPLNYTILLEKPLYDLRSKYAEIPHYGMRDVRLFLRNVSVKDSKQIELWVSFHCLDHEGEENSSHQMAVAKVCRSVLRNRNYYSAFHLMVDQILGCPLRQENKEKQDILLVKTVYYLDRIESQEKNWLVLPSKEVDSQPNTRIPFVYRCYPFQRIFANLSTGKLQCIFNAKGKDDIEGPINEYDWKNSCGPLQWEQGSLFLVYETLESKNILHRFLWFAKDDSLQKKTYPFFFWDGKREAVLSMCFASNHQDLVLAVGKKRIEAILLTITAETLLSLLYVVKVKKEGRKPP
jgi:hypothetical protein